MSGLTFDERMSGWLGRGELDFHAGLTTGKREETPLAFELHIAIDDVDAFLGDPRRQARAEGWVESPLLGGRRPVLPGSTFNLIVEVPGHRRMLYRLFVEDAAGHPVTVSGFKVIHDDPGFDVWADTTDLRTTLLRGHLDEAEEARERPGAVRAAGVVSISRTGFLKLLFGMQGRARDRARFGSAFMGELWKVYGGRSKPGQDAFPDPTPWDDGDEPPEWERLRERGLHAELIKTRSGDGHPLGLHHFRGDAEPTKGPVLLVAGTGVRANIFSGAPARSTLVDALVADGYDVWVEDWRASIAYPAHDYTLDQAAVFDHPAAVREVKQRTGADAIKAVVHCQGSTSFTMSALAGLVPDVKTVVSNAVSLHPTVSPLSKVKLTAVVPLAGSMLKGVDPQWAVRAPTAVQKALATWVRLIRNDCAEPACAMSTYIYGFGPDVLWRHDNLDHETHHWVAREFGYVPFTFFKQIARSVRKGHLVPIDGLSALPESFVDAPAPEGQAWTFLAGGVNRCFLPDSQRKTHAWFEARQPGRHQYEELPGYTHLDVFFGKHAPEQTHPRILAALEREPA